MAKKRVFVSITAVVEEKKINVMGVMSEGTDEMSASLAMMLIRKAVRDALKARGFDQEELELFYIYEQV